MWSYYGSKTNVVKRYPKPRPGYKIKECFAGTGRYSLEYFDRDVLLVDKWPVIIDIWKWLQQCSPNDILSLPRTLTPGDLVKNMTFDCEAQKNFYGFVIGAGQQYPVRTVGKRRTINRPNAINYCLQSCAKQLYKIKHWQFICASYIDMPDQEEAATWFIDPPYQYGGHKYAMSNRDIDFAHLAQWCKSRNGQAIVCENMRATWLPFVPLVQQQGSNGYQSEAIFTNYHTAYNNVQQSLF